MIAPHVAAGILFFAVLHVSHAVLSDTLLLEGFRNHRDRHPALADDVAHPSNKRQKSLLVRRESLLSSPASNATDAAAAPALQAGVMSAAVVAVVPDDQPVPSKGYHAVQVQTQTACGVTLCLLIFAVIVWHGHAPLNTTAPAPDVAGRDLLLDNVRVWAVAMVVWGHFIYYNMGWDASTTYHDNLTWLKNFHGLGSHVLRFIGALRMPAACFVSGYVSKGSPSVQRTRRYVQYLLIPTLIWIFFAKPVVMEFMMEPTIELLRAKRDAMMEFNLFHNEWYLQALCMWRASAFLIWCHLRPSVSMASMLLLSCAAGYVEFTGLGAKMQLAETFGFLPYFAAGYTFPKGWLHAFASWRSPETVVVALLFVVIWIESVIPLLSQGKLPDAHGSYTCCDAGDVFANTSAHHIDHALYWTRRLSKFGLEIVPAMVMLMLVTPHGEMCGLSWIGPHTIYPFVFHEVANHWRDRFIQIVGPPVITSTSGHVLVLLLHTVWALCVMAFFSTSVFRRAFAWCFCPTWMTPLLNFAHEAMNTMANGFSRQHKSETLDNSLGQAHQKDFPRLAEAMPSMLEARPFYPVLLPLYTVCVVSPILLLKAAQHLGGFPSLARLLEIICQYYFPWLLLVAVISVGERLIAYGWHTKRFSTALEEPGPSKFTGLLKHVVVVPSYKEPLSVLRRTMATIASQTHASQKRRPTVVLACEARDPSATASFHALQSEFTESFEDFVLTQHVLLLGEVPGKSSNVNFAVRELYARFVDDKHLDPFSIMITVCDADSLFSPLYLAEVEAAFWHQRDGRRLIYSAPLNTYRNFSSGGVLTQMYELLRSHNDAFFSPLSHFQPQSNYSLTLGFIQEIDFWTPDNIPEDVHTCRRAQVNNLCSMTTVPIGAYIVNDLVENFFDRYAQAKRHRWGITEIAWVFGMHYHMPFSSWLHLLRVEISAGTFFEEVHLLLRFVFQIWILTSMWCERRVRDYGYGLELLVAVFIFNWISFWLGELFLWRKVISCFPIEKPSLLTWAFLVGLCPVLKILTDIIFHIVPTWDCLIHVTFFGELIYVNAPKGTELERVKLRQMENAAAEDSMLRPTIQSNEVRHGAVLRNTFDASYAETLMEDQGRCQPQAIVVGDIITSDLVNNRPVPAPARVAG